MSQLADLQFYGIDKLQLRLQQLQRRAGENMAKRVVRAAAKPALAEIRRHTPVKTGALAASLAIQVQGSTRGAGEVRAYVWPKKTFQAGKKATGKIRFKGGATGERDRGLLRRKAHPLTYVATIEKDHAHMIAKGRQATTHTTLGLLRAELRRELGL